MLKYLPAIVMAAWLLALCASDLRERRLPNALTLGGAAVALVWRLGIGGLPALWSGVSGGFFCALLLLVPFFLHAAGGGDVKMLFVVGAALGRNHVVGTLFYVSTAGLVLAALFALFGRVDRSRLVHYARSVFDWRYDRKAGWAALPPKSSEKCRVPFGLAIAAGAWLEMFWPL